MPSWPIGSHAIDAEFANFARRQLYQCDIAFFAQQLRRTARRTHYLSAFARIQFQVVHHGAGRNVPERQGVSRQNVRAFAVLNRRAYFQPNRMQDVALFAVRIVQQREARRAVRIIFDRRNLGRDAGLVAAEIDGAIALARGRRRGARK